MMNKVYQVAGHRFCISGDRLCKVVDSIKGFTPFLVNETDVLFSFHESEDIPEICSVQYHFDYEGVVGRFGRMENGYVLSLTPEDGEPLFSWNIDGQSQLHISGNYELRLIRFALWLGYGLMTLPYDTVAIHTSCIVYNDKAVLFLGESGTGKSTHTRLWREHVSGSFLLNDDSPIIRVENGRIRAYGSPWSGKTHCYRTDSYELQGCVRLSQAPYNQIRKLSTLQAYGAIHPSCPPEFAYDRALYDHIGNFLNSLLTHIPFYHLACLPDAEAAYLSCRTLFTD